MKRRLLLILGLSLLFVSCVDPICYEYRVDLALKNKEFDNMRYYAYIKDDDDKYIVSTYLKRENGFVGIDGIWSMGPQLDYREPDVELSTKLNKIKDGGIYTIDEVDSDYHSVPKYTIECTPEDVKEIIDDRLYRCYEITLDWNKRVPISE